MITVQVDEKRMDELAKEEIKKRLEENNLGLTFWDTSELRRRTCMSWSTIQDTFFHQEGFPKAKIGGKWYFPAKEAEEFLLAWLGGRKL